MGLSGLRLETRGLTGLIGTALVTRGLATVTDLGEAPVIVRMFRSTFWFRRHS